MGTECLGTGQASSSGTVLGANVIEGITTEWRDFKDLLQPMPYTY